MQSDDPWQGVDVFPQMCVLADTQMAGSRPNCCWLLVTKGGYWQNAATPLCHIQELGLAWAWVAWVELQKHAASSTRVHAIQDSSTLPVIGFAASCPRCAMLAGLTRTEFGSDSQGSSLLRRVRHGLSILAGPFSEISHVGPV